jgi:hypothetical protein
MVQLVLSDEQAKIIDEARGNVTVCDSRGRYLGHLCPADSPEEIAEAKRRLGTDQRRYTTAEVLSHLSSVGAR